MAFRVASRYSGRMRFGDNTASRRAACGLWQCPYDCVKEYTSHKVSRAILAAARRPVVSFVDVELAEPVKGTKVSSSATSKAAKDTNPSGKIDPSGHTNFKAEMLQSSVYLQQLQCKYFPVVKTREPSAAPVYSASSATKLAAPCSSSDSSSGGESCLQQQAAQKPSVAAALPASQHMQQRDSQGHTAGTGQLVLRRPRASSVRQQRLRKLASGAHVESSPLKAQAATCGNQLHIARACYAYQAAVQCLQNSSEQGFNLQQQQAHKALQTAWAVLTEAYEPMIYRMAYHAFASGQFTLQRGDYLQAAREGLRQAALRYQPKKGAFSTVAFIYIRKQLVSLHQRQQQLLSGMGMEFLSQASKVKKAVEALENKGSTLPTVADIAQECGLSTSVVAKVQKILNTTIQGLESTSTDKQGLGARVAQAVPAADQIGDCVMSDTESFTAASYQHEALLQFMWNVSSSDSLRSALTKKQRQVVELVYGLQDDMPRTVAQVAVELNTSRQAVEQLLAIALKNLRSQISGNFMLELEAAAGDV